LLKESRSGTCKGRQDFKARKKHKNTTTRNVDLVRTRTYITARAHTHTPYLVRTYTVEDLRGKYFPEPDAFAYEYSKVCFYHESRVLTFFNSKLLPYRTGKRLYTQNLKFEI